MKSRNDYLKNIPPFNLLPEIVISEVSQMMSYKVYPQEETIYLQDVSKVDSVDIIVKGSYKAYFYDSDKVIRLEELYKENDIFRGSTVLLNKQYSIRTVIAQANTEMLILPKDEFKALCRSYHEFFQHFTEQFGNKMLNDEYAQFVKRNSMFEENFMDADLIYTRTISSITPRLLVTCTPETPLYKVATLMSDKAVNCVYIEKNKDLIAFVSKDILVKSALASQKHPDTPIIEVAQKNIITLQKDALVYEALLALYPTRQEYLLVKDGQENLGYLSRYRLLTEHAKSPMVFIQSVKLSNTVFDLKEKWSKVPEFISSMIGRGVNSRIVNQIISTIADEILLRVIDIVNKEMASAPAKFCFMVMGSEGRQEQTLATDQDNAIIYEDKANEHREEVREYFLDYADRISTRLNDIGFKFCEGGFMAKNPKWCHSLSHWKSNYNNWITEANPDTVIQFSTFFDCRFVYGDKTLFDALNNHMADCLNNSSTKFLYSLVKNALHYEPPLTIFKGIKTIVKNDEKVFNIKHAMSPIVDLMRMYALQHKIFETNTGKRLKALYEAGHYSETQYKEITHAYYYLMGVRLKNQSAQILHEFKEPDNFVPPKRLTAVEQATLREIFKFIKYTQMGVKMRFNAPG